MPRTLSNRKVKKNEPYNTARSSELKAKQQPTPATAATADDSSAMSDTEDVVLDLPSPPPIAATADDSSAMSDTEDEDDEPPPTQDTQDTGYFESPPPPTAPPTPTSPPATHSNELPRLSVSSYNLPDGSKEWEALKLLFQYGLSIVKGKRKLYESSMGSTNVQMTMAGYIEPDDYDTYNGMDTQYNPDKGIDWDTFKQYYSWFTGVKMHRDGDMELTDNEHEHVLPVGFMFLFGGGLSKQLLDTFTEKVNFPGPNPADFNGNANSVNRKMDIALKSWKKEPMTEPNITYEAYKKVNLTNPPTSRQLNKVAVDYWNTPGKGTYTANMRDFWNTVDGIKLQKRLNDIKEATIDQPLSDRLITDRVGQNKAIDLLKCIYNDDKAKIKEFLKNQLNLNKYGYFLSEAKANRIKSDYVFVRLVRDSGNNKISFNVDNDAVDAFVGQIKLFFDSINIRLVQGVNVPRSADDTNIVYSKNKFTGNWVSTSEGSINMHKGFDEEKSKKIMKAVLEKLVYYLNIDIRNRIFFNIVMAPLYLEKTVESRISKLPRTPQVFQSNTTYNTPSNSRGGHQAGGDGTRWGVIDSSQYLMDEQNADSETKKKELQIALTAELEKMKGYIFVSTTGLDVNKFVEHLELNLVKITIPNQDDEIYGLEITKLLKHESLKKNQNDKVPDDEYGYDVEDGTVYIPYIDNRNSDIQMWDLFQWVDPMNKFKDIDEPSSEDEYTSEEQLEKQTSRTAHIVFVEEYLNANQAISSCISGYINDPLGDNALKQRLKQLMIITSKTEVVGGFKNTKNPSKNKKRKKTRRKKKIKRKKHTRRKHLNKSK
jgi:hypothetical protein